MTPDDLDTISKLVRKDFNLTAELTALPGYQDRNYLIIIPQGEKFILKITTDPDELDFIKSQNGILSRLSDGSIGPVIPTPMPNRNGQMITEWSFGEQKAHARLFPYLEGDFLADVKPDLDFFRELGRTFGEIDLCLTGLEDPVLKCRTHEWDLSRVQELKDHLHLVSNPADRRLVHYFLMKHREEVVPVFHRLPRTLIHGDGNDYNILVGRGDPRLRREDRGEAFCITGVLDFGDMVYTARIHEVAILLAYAMINRQDFPDVYRYVVEGYQKAIPLSDIELSVLYFLVAARWCQTMVMAGRQDRKNPGSAYHQISVRGASEMLERWVRVNPAWLREKKDIREEREDREDVAGTLGKVPNTDVERRYRYFSRAVSLSYRKPIQMTGAAMQYMYAADGRTYLDCVNNIPHVGHCHPRVVEAGQRQMALLNTNTRYLYRSLDLYAEKLLSKFPPTLDKVFFVNSGSAATDLAVRLVMAHTGRDEFLVLDHAYHGNTISAIGLSPYKFNRKGGTGKPGNVTVIPLMTADGGQQTADPPHSPAAFFAEPIPGCAGQVMLTREFMQEIYGAVRSRGGVCVSDEVQTGFGRVGHHFWGYELYDVVPDIVILGKPMANGHPMGALVCTGEIARSFETGMEFFSSFGGNPVSCEIARSVLEVIEEEELQKNAREIGDFLLSELRRVFRPTTDNRGPATEDGRACHSSRVTGKVSEVRGSGLFLGIEFTDAESRLPNTEKAISVVSRMKERGFLLSTDGPYNNVIKFKPPMCFSMSNAEEILSALKTEIFV